MAEQTQVQQVTMEDPKKVEAVKTLAEWNRRKKEENAQMTKAQSEFKLTYYGAGAIVAIRALSVLGYYIYQSKKTLKKTLVYQINETPVYQTNETPDKFKMD